MFKLRRRTNRGYTLVELLVVIVLIGIVAAIVAPSVNSLIQRSASARAIANFADQSQRALQSITVATGSPAVVTGNPVPQTNNTLLDVLIAGEPVVNAAVINGFRDAGLNPLDRSVVITTQPVPGTSAGVYTVENYAVTLVDNGQGQALVRYTSVPEDVIEKVLASRESVAFDGTSAKTTGAVRHTVVAGGVADMDILVRF